MSPVKVLPELEEEICEAGPMRVLMLGNAAIARGAFEAGVRFASAYPGTPSTEILENMAQYRAIRSEWASNEKVALDAAMGASFAGHRALAAMKHVGLNVAADSLFASAYTGVKGGLVIVVADDPGMFSSQNEQDSRQYARFAKLPMLEPADAQECKDFVAIALDMSEEFDTPVLLRTTMRVSHGKSLVEIHETAVGGVPDKPRFAKAPSKYVMIPAHARPRHPIIEERLRKLAEYAETSPLNRIELGHSFTSLKHKPRLGIISSGHAYLCAREVFPNASFLKLGMAYPLPKNLIREFAQTVDKVVVIEELDPFFEEQIRLMGMDVVGKDVFPVVGELHTSVIRERAIQAGLLEATDDGRRTTVEGFGFEMATRTPTLCAGCSHRGVFYVLNKLRLVVFGDIGCYSMGVLPPFNAMDTITCMGASIGVAHGAQQAGIADRAVAVIGDSTFFHAGIPALANVVYNQGTSVTLILDNGTTAMTGAQDNPGTGKTLMGEMSPKIDLEAVVRALGVQDVRVVDAFDIDLIERELKAALAVTDRPSVLIIRGPCVFVDRPERALLWVDPVKCTGCGLCFRVGCPAIIKDPEGRLFRDKKPLAFIDALQCTGCDICRQVCNLNAIFPVDGGSE